MRSAYTTGRKESEKSSRDEVDQSASHLQTSSTEKEPGPLHRAELAVEFDSEEEGIQDGLGIRPKLTVNESGEKCEKEAERVADAVRHKSASDSAADARKVEGHLRERTSGKSVIEDGTRQQIESLREGGRPLPPKTRLFFESQFDHDFSGVRVHTGPQADKTAGSIGAEAFTIGNDVAFASGKYRPHRSEGEKLLAHELTHVVQQSGAQDTGTLHRQQSNQGKSSTESKKKGGGALGKIPDEYKEAAKKAFKAARKTEFGQDLTKRGLSALKKYWKTAPGKVFLPLAGLGTIILTDGPLPLSAPSIPLDTLFPNDDLRGLSVNVHLHGLPTSSASIPHMGEKVKAGVSIDDPFPLSLSGSIQGRKAPGVDYQFMVKINPMELTKELTKEKKK